MSAATFLSVRWSSRNVAAAAVRAVRAVTTADPKWWRGTVRSARRASSARDANTTDVLPRRDREVFRGFVLATEGAHGANTPVAPKAQLEARPFVLPTEGAHGANTLVAPKAQGQAHTFVLPTEGAHGANNRTAPRAPLEARLFALPTEGAHGANTLVAPKVQGQAHTFVLPTEGAHGANILRDTRGPLCHHFDLSQSTTRTSVPIATTSSTQGLPSSNSSLSTRFGCASCWTAFWRSETANMTVFLVPPKIQLVTRINTYR